MASQSTSSRNAGPKLGFQVSLYVLLIVLSGITSEESKSPERTWYVGCFRRLKEPNVLDLTIQDNLESCSRTCDIQGFPYIAISGDKCVCEQSLDLFDELSQSACDISCTNIPERQLPCGGYKSRSWSVYRAAGPWLVGVEPAVQGRWVEPGYPISLIATVTLRGVWNINREPYIESEWGNTVELTWQSEEVTLPRAGTMNILANSSQETVVWSVTFPGPGTFPIELQVKSLLSNLRVPFNVTVVEPKPRDLQLLQTNHPWTLPSCIPLRAHLFEKNDMYVMPNVAHALWGSKTEGLSSWKPTRGSGSNLPLVAVFVNTTFKLEVSTAAGLDLVFDVNIWDGREWQVFRHTPFQEYGKRDNCASEPQECRSIVQEFVFRRTGIFSASVHVSNAYGLLEKNISIVVIDQHIRDVSAQLEPPSRAVAFTEEVLVFQLQAYTADRNFTMIRVDFGDGIVKTASVRERQTASLQSYDPEMVTLLADYGDGCTLSLKFDHQYFQEGTFLPLITLYNNVSSVTVELEETVFVVHEIKDILIESPKVGAKDKPIPFAARINKTSENATAEWRVYDNNGNHVTNGDAFPQGLEVFLTFGDTGRYKVVCKTFNVMSSQTDSTHITIHSVQQPVKGLTVSCNQGLFLEIEQEITCEANVEGGEDVAFVWDFQDQSNLTYVEDDGERTSVAKHTFLYPGSYKVTVKAHNVLNELTQDLDYNVHVQVAVSCLNVTSSSPALPGEPIRIIATTGTGTDLAFEYRLLGDHGKISRQYDSGSKNLKRLEQNVITFNGSTIYSESVILLESTGSHTLQVRAWNQISNSSGTVELIVRKHPPKFKIIRMPSSSSSVVILAVQTLDGAALYRDDFIFTFHFPGEVPHLTQVPVVTRDVHSAYHQPSPSTSSSFSPPLPSSSSSFSSRDAVTTQSVSKTPNWLLEEARPRPLPHDQDISEETEGRGRRVKRVALREHVKSTRESEEKVHNGYDEDLVSESQPDRIPAGEYTGPIAVGGEGSAGRKRVWSRPGSEMREPPTPGSSADSLESAAVPGTLGGSARLTGEREQTPMAGDVDLVHISVANEVGTETATVHLSAGNLRAGSNNHAADKEKNLESQLSHPAIVIVGASVQFGLHLQDSAEDVTLLNVNYGNALQENVSCARDRCSWRRQFHVPGVYSLVASLYGRQAGERGRPLRSMLVVEEPIKGLHIRGPTDVAIGCDQVWEAVVSAGSHIIYQWSLDGSPLQPAVRARLSQGFLKPGEHELQVKAFNDIGSEETSITLSARRPLKDVKLFVPTESVHGVPTTITLWMDGDASFDISCDFGDGQITSFYTHSSASSRKFLNLDSIQGSQLLQVKEISVKLNAPKNAVGTSTVMYEANISHTYAKSGHFFISILVNDGLTKVKRSRHLVVEEAIGEVKLTIHTPYVMSIDEKLLVTAEVSSGQNLKFVWDFSDSNMPTTVESDGSVSRARHTFNIPDTYTVSVNVSNHIQKRGIKVSLPQRIIVVTMVQDVILQHIPPNGYKGAKWTAPLFVENMGTEPVNFKGVSHGSPVMFAFDFGDGNSSTVKGWYEFGNMRMAAASHVYTKEGFYTVRLTAFNALSNVSTERTLSVHVPPSGLRLQSSAVCVESSEEVRLNASTERGANVTYSWKLGDQTELVNADAEVSHEFRNVGNCTVFVTALNNYGQATDNVTVNVVAKIQEVTVKVESTRIYVDKSIRYRAVITPESASLGAQYIWNFGDNIEHRISHSPEYTHTAVKAGRRFVQVVASNCLGEVDSKPIPVDVLAELRGLNIMVLKKGIAPNPVKLKADYYMGTGLSFHWDFGDGTKREVNRSDYVQHFYTRVGEYTITLTANNSISLKTVTVKMFLLTKPCDPPTLHIVFPRRTSDHKELATLCSEPIHLESEVELKCTTSSQIKYHWELWHKNGTKFTAFPTLAGKKSKLFFKTPSLLLPAGTLQVGQYFVKLRVDMKETEIPVYSVVQRDLFIKSALPVSHIFGGIQRFVGKNGSIWLDGELSGTPQRESSSVKYRWTCLPYSDHKASCFNQSINHPHPEMNETTLYFPANRLNTSFADFVFKLKVSNSAMFKDTHNSKESKVAKDETSVEVPVRSEESEQLLSIKPQTELIDVFLECLQCQENMVNVHTTISLRALTPWWPVDKALAYTWTVSQFDDEDGETRAWQVHRRCVQADGSSYHLLILGGNSTENTTEEDINRSGERGNTTNSSPSLPGTNGVALQNQAISEATREREENAKQEITSSKDIKNPITYVDVAESLGPKSRGQTRRGKGNSGTNKSTGRGGSSVNSRESSDRGRDELPPDCDGRDCIRRDPSPGPADPPHMLRRSHTPIWLPASKTLTGLHQPSLVIKPGLLDQGRTYLVRVTVKAEDGTNGEAKTFFKVNPSPSKGRCTVRPTEGYAMETDFKVFCKEWQDEHQPLRYALSYSVSPSEEPRVVYQGLRHSISFKLLQGPPETNHTVLLHVAVLDSLGGRTVICRIPVQVKPQAKFLSISPGQGHRFGSADGHRSRARHRHKNVKQRVQIHPPAAADGGTSQRLHEEAKRVSKLTLTSTFGGSNIGLLLPLTQLALRFNQQAQHAPCRHSPPLSETSPGQKNLKLDAASAPTITQTALQKADLCHSRARARELLFKALENVPLRDEVEIVQALSCIVEATAVPEEVNWHALQQAKTRLLEIIGDIEARLSAPHASGHSSELSGRGLRLTVGAVSNLLQSLAIQLRDADGTEQRLQGFYRNITDVGLQVLNQAIQIALQFQSIGETPLSLGREFVYVNASLYSVSASPPSVSIRGVSFQLPRDLRSLVLTPANIQGKEKNQSIIRQTELSRNEDGTSKESSGPGLQKLSGESERSRGDYRGYQSVSSCYQTRTILFSRNPYAFMAKDGDLVQTEVASLDVYNCDGSEKLSVQNLPSDDNIDIVLPRADFARHEAETATSSKHYLDKTVMNVHHLNSSLPLRDPNTRQSKERKLKRSHFDQSDSGQLSSDMSRGYLHVHIQFDPVPQTRRSFPVLVILSHRNPPLNLEDYVLKEHHERSVQEIKILLPSNSLEDGQQYHVGIAEASFNSGRRRPTEVQGRNYTFNAWWSSCLYWNTSAEGWQSNGCSVMPSSRVHQLHCQCNHLTTFGSHFELISTYLTHTEVNEFFDGLHENSLVVVLVVLVLLIYIVGVVLLSSADAQDTRKDASGCVYLQDNAPSHHQKYEISLETGFNRHAGTTSKISIILHGEESMSETRELTSEDRRPMFECNSRDRFIMTLPESLGRIQKIQLWHNNSGSSPGWFLRQAVVRDLNSGQAAYFLCQRWLAVDKDDGKVEREFTTVEGRNISFNMVFWLKGSQYLSDLHTWMSVLTRPPHSRFTRIQRITVCLTLLSSYMCLSAIWFKGMHQEIHREFGLLDLSWQNIAVGCACCLIVAPVNLLLGFLFRRSKVHYPGYERDRALLSDVSKLGGTGLGDQSEGEDEAGHSQVTYSILDQSILNWQSIQDWAQKQWLKRQQSVRSSNNSVKTSQTSPQLSAPSTTPLVQTLLAEYDTDHASSAWDASSRLVTEKMQTKTTSEESSTGNISDVLNSTRRVFLPFWCRYLAWTLCIIIICPSVTLTVMYGFRFGHTKSVMWIQSVYFSFVVCIFILQPLLILLKVLHTAWRHRKNVAVFNHYEDGFYGEREIPGAFNKQISFSSGDDELQRGVAARSRSRYLRFAGPPQEKQLKSSRKRQIKQKRALCLLRDIIYFLGMIAILGTIAFGKNTWSPYLFNNAVKAALAEKSQDGISFMTIKSPQDWYKWCKATIIDSLYPQTMFTGEEQNSSFHHGKGQTVTTNWMILGQIHLRQLSSLPRGCKLDPYFRSGVDYLRCQQSEIIGSEAEEDLNSKSISRGSSYSRFFMKAPIWGGSSWYDDSGYVIKLDKFRDAATNQFQELEEKQWINTDTEALFIEMTLYNAPANLFSSVTLLLEISQPLGKIFTTNYVMSTRLFRYVTWFDSVILACELMFVVITLWMIYLELQVAVKLGKTYFYHFWHYLQLSMCIASISYVLVYACRFILVSDAIETMRSTFFEEFVNMYLICLCDQVLTDLVAIVLFCVIVKSLRILRYHQLFWRLQTVYRRCRREIYYASVMYICFVTAFGCLATGLFGSTMRSLRSVWSSLLSMSALSIRVLNWADDMDGSATQKQVVDVVIVFGYTFIHGAVLTYIFAVLSQRLKKTRKSRVLALTGHQLVSFYWDVLLKTIGVRKEPSIEHTDNTLSAEFTMAEILYLVEELLFRMNAVLGTSGLPDKYRSLSDSDGTQNAGEDATSSGEFMDNAVMISDEMPILTQSEDHMPRLEQRLQKIEDKLCSQEPYLAQLLKLDSIGADVLSEEKEQELRSHLEFEIFRQLQLQRRLTEAAEDPNAHCNAHFVDDPFDSLNVPGLEHIEEAVTNLLSRQSSLSKAAQSTNSMPLSNVAPNIQISPAHQNPLIFKGHVNQGLQSLPSDTNENRPTLLTSKRTLSLKTNEKEAKSHQLLDPRQRSDFLSQDTVTDRNLKGKPEKNPIGLFQKFQQQPNRKDCLSTTTVGAGPSPDKRFRVDVLYRPDGTPSSSRSGGNSSGRDSDTPAKSQMKIRHGLVGCSKLSAGTASPQSSESDRVNRYNDSSSGFSGHERTNLLSKKPELPSKSSYTRNIAPAHIPEISAIGSSAMSAGPSGKNLTGWAPKPRQFKFLPELINPLAAESSSGSEPEATARNRGTQGRRNLRKTKSRGKGKGREGGISNSIDLTADFGSGAQSGGSEFDIIIHRVPTEFDQDEDILAEEFPHL